MNRNRIIEDSLKNRNKNNEMNENLTIIKN